MVSLFPKFTFSIKHVLLLYLLHTLASKSLIINRAAY